MALTESHQSVGGIANDQGNESQLAKLCKILQDENDASEANRSDESDMPFPTKIVTQVDDGRYSLWNSTMCAGPAAAMPKQLPKQKEADGKSCSEADGNDLTAYHVSEAGSMPKHSITAEESNVEQANTTASSGDNLEAQPSQQSQTAKKTKRRRHRQKSLIDIAEQQQRQARAALEQGMHSAPVLQHRQVAAAANQGAKKFCPFCRAPVLSNFKFCTDCGGDVAAIWNL